LTDKPAIAAVVLAGFAASAQIGKVPAAMTTIGAEFGMGLAEAALLVSLFALLAGTGGLAIGLAAGRIGARRGLLAGLAVAACAATLAPLMPGAIPLLAVRIVEGAGFVLVAVSAPALVATLASARDRPVAMGVWGTFMPGGIALGLLTAPIVEALGWRAAWLTAAALLVVALLLCWRLVPATAGAATSGPRPGMGAQLRGVIAARRPLYVAGIFGAYNIIYFGLAAFLPAYLESLGTRTGAAGGAAALAAIANVAGNLVAAALMRRGTAPERLAIGGAAAMAVLVALVFAVPVAWIAVSLALLASLVGGLLPAACFALLPGSVPSLALVPPAMGMTIQANNLMQVLTPPLLGAVASIAWPLMALPLMLAGAVAALFGAKLARDGLPTLRPSP
jgi:MFS family permease